MQNALSSLKWILIIVSILFFFLLWIWNRDVQHPFVLLPGMLEFESVPLTASLIFGFLSAFGVLFVAGILDQVSDYFTQRELRKKIRDLENEVSSLRNLPIRENMQSQRAVEQENRA